MEGQIMLRWNSRTILALIGSFSLAVGCQDAPAPSMTPAPPAAGTTTATPEGEKTEETPMEATPKAEGGSGESSPDGVTVPTPEVKPAEDKPAETKPAEDKPAEEKPAEEKKAE